MSKKRAFGRLFGGVITKDTAWGFYEMGYFDMLTKEYGLRSKELDDFFECKGTHYKDAKKQFTRHWRIHLEE